MIRVPYYVGDLNRDPNLENHLSDMGRNPMLHGEPPQGSDKHRLPHFVAKQNNVGALIIRIGFGGFLITIIVEYTPNPILTIKAPILPCICMAAPSTGLSSEPAIQGSYLEGRGY